ncbi:BTAD domain-containing putative transcriptional regulator [Kitasatospora sp. NPDC002227]|uniref:AfsR/SARP family transcriptional regulator n=1 Tax=Kitasatospora sp. NPDC002227 TaxID=3154773 RepID=UPI003319B031
MRFTLLGPLAVRDEAGSRAIGTRKVQLLLALLLLEANRPVSAERIKLTLWGERPPSTVNASLYNHVAQLRRALAGPGPERVARLHQGYSLRVEPGELDAEEFAEHVQQARQAYLAEDWARTVRRASAALALWRGEPLAELAGSLDAGARLSTYAQARLQALEWRFDAELALGHHHGLIPELTALAGEHPLHEPFHRQLMLALHRTGRQSDAIAVHQQLVRTLARELGVTPGADVQAAHREVLSGPAPAPTPSAPAPEPAVPAPPAAPVASGPAQLPRPTPSFVGRGDELAVLAAHLTERQAEPPVVVLSGMPGVGKSALAARVGRQLAAEFPDGQLYLNLRGSTASPVAVAPAEALEQLLGALGVEAQQVPSDLDAAAALLRSTLAGRHVLILLDDAGSAAQVRSLLPGAFGCAVLVTSRSPLAALDCTLRLSLTPLPEPQALALLDKVVGAERVAAEADAARRVLELCGRLPLAVRVVAARLVARPSLSLATLCDQLDDETERLDHLAYDDLSVRRSLALAHRALTTSADPVDRLAALALRRLGAIALVEYEAAAVARLLDCPAGRAEAALARLAGVALLEELRPGRYGLHDLVRDFSRELGLREDGEQERGQALGRALRWYADQAGGTSVTILPAGSGRGRVLDEAAADAAFADAAAALDWYDQEVPNLGVLIEQHLAHPLGPVLVRALTPVMQYRGHWSTLGKINDLALAAARETGDRWAQAFSLHDGAGTLFIAGDFEAALARVEQALELWRELGAHTFELAASNNRGTLLEYLGRYEEAAAVIEGVLELDQGADDYTRAVALNNLGNLYEHTDPLKAIEAHRRSLELGEGISVPGFQCAAHSNIGFAYLRLGRPAEALPHFEQSVELADGEGSDWLAEYTARLGFVQSLRELTDHRQALAESRRLLELTETQQDTYSEGLARHQYGLALRAAGEPAAAAVEQWSQALRLLESTDNTAVVTELRDLLAADDAQG